MGKTLIISVGGSPSPIICSINFHRPENIIFFTSLETESQIAEILRRIDLSSIRNTDKIITQSAENINFCLNAILTTLPEILSRWKTTIDEVIVDYTGGTKSMSSALVLGTIEYTKCFSYVGAKDEKGRDKDGIGVVIDGQEKVITLRNPWDELAVDEKKKICLLFNSGRYLAAKEISEQAARKVSERQKSLFDMVTRFSEAYYKWDSFDYDGALHFLKRAINELKIICSQLPNNHGIVNFWQKAKENLDFLNVIVHGKEEESGKLPKETNAKEENLEISDPKLKSEEYRLYDLLANAKRRAILENRYDDALVRLYRALEKRAQLELKKYNIDASNVNLDLVPTKLKEKIRFKYFNERTNKAEIPLYGAYCLLKALEEEEGRRGIGHRFFELYEPVIRTIIDMRNNNIIVHGNVLADKDKFDDAWKNCLQFLGIDEASLPQFPQLEL
ncbi:MAG: TIGR02710 family CRISPR-associated CARF protein [Candidatus Aminicenantes bacterium]|nr:TIGR02710 family CRISPR-associated CARF protein [Candidatus Aminicenantes bacterium]